MHGEVVLMQGDDFTVEVFLMHTSGVTRGWARGL